MMRTGMSWNFLKFWIVCPLKSPIFGRSKHLKNSIKILANTFSDSLAILKKNCRLTPAKFFHRKIPGSLPVPITVSELWEWLFPFPPYNSLRERTPPDGGEVMRRPGSAEEGHYWRPSSSFWTNVDPLLRPEEALTIYGGALSHSSHTEFEGFSTAKPDLYPQIRKKIESKIE